VNDGACVPLNELRVCDEARDFALWLDRNNAQASAVSLDFERLPGRKNTIQEAVEIRT